MYSLALDESGTHAGSPVLLVAGLAVHEADVKPLEETIHGTLETHLKPLGLDPFEFEAHAGELKTPTRARAASGRRGPRPASVWFQVPAATRLLILEDLYAALGAFQPGDEDFPVRLFAAVIDRGNMTQPKVERMAYDHVLHRFDEMLLEVSANSGTEQRGVVLHDRRDGYDRGIQEQVGRWRRQPGRLEQFVHVPMFTDSRSSRMVQAADFVAYAIWRHYTAAEARFADALWPMSGTGPQGELIGAIHRSPEFAKRTCTCPPCTSRY